MSIFKDYKYPESLPPEKRKFIVYGFQDKPPTGYAIFLGFQQFLIMFGATVSIPLLLGSIMGAPPEVTAKLISVIFFISGITSIIQTRLSGLPIVQGGSFSFLGPVIAIIIGLKGAGVSPTTMMQYISISITIPSFLTMILGGFGIIGKLRRYLTPVSIGPVVALIGLALFDVGAPAVAPNVFLGGLVVFLIILFSQFLSRKSRFFMFFPIILSVIIAWLVAGILTAAGVYKPGDPGYLDLTPVQQAPILQPPLPFPWGPPLINPAFILGTMAGTVVSMIESFGDYHSVSRIAEAPPPSEKCISRGVLADAIGEFLAGIFGSCNGSTSYSENIASIGITRVASRWIIQIGGVFMILLSLSGHFAAFFATLPFPIVGGVWLAVFGMIAAVGLSLLSMCDMKSGRNLFIVGMAFFWGLSIPAYFKGYNPFGIPAGKVIIPEPLAWLGDLGTIVGSTGMAVGAIVGIILDNILPGTPEERGITHPDWAGEMGVAVPAK